MYRRRCIDPLIALIILIGVTITIAVAFASWAMGLWNTQSRVVEAITIEGSQYTPSNYTLKILLHVHMKPKAVIYKVTISGEEVEYWLDSIEVGAVTFDQSTGKIIAPVGSKFWLGAKLPKPLPSGTAVEVRIYTETGYMYRTTIIL